MDIFAQVIGIIAMIFNVVSYQGRTQRQIMVIRLVSAVFFVIHFLLLQQMTGFMLNIIAVMMGFVFAFKPKKFAESVLWVPFFIALVLTAYVLNFTVFKQEPTAYNFIINVLPVVGMIICIFAFRMDKASKVRFLSLFSSPCWLIYDAISLSIGGTVTESFAICSNLFAIFTQDLKIIKLKGKKKEVKEEDTAKEDNE